MYIEHVPPNCMHMNASAQKMLYSIILAIDTLKESSQLTSSTNNIRMYVGHCLAVCSSCTVDRVPGVGEVGRRGGGGKGRGREGEGRGGEGRGGKRDSGEGLPPSTPPPPTHFEA